VLRTACAQVAAWTRVSGRRLCLGVNVSAHQLRQGDLVETVTAALAESGLAAAQLELEVTETAILVDQRAAARTLEKIADLGVMVALDDFGTGYSSLAHLCELPINRLKIDRSFVGRLPEARNAAAVCRAVIDLADDLGITVIAEGVETPEQVAFLCDHGCTAAQGYLYGKPVPAQELGQRLLPAQQPGLRLLPAQELDLSSLPAVGEAGGA
jgi:EAL domain-containing protein (putative c-di-GMP-specific phosphodiesterase class I)